MRCRCAGSKFVDYGSNSASLSSFCSKVCTEGFFEFKFWNKQHDSGRAQVHFGDALAVIGGVERKIHFFALDLPHSDGRAAAYIEIVRKRFSWHRVGNISVKSDLQLAASSIRYLQHLDCFDSLEPPRAVPWSGDVSVSNSNILAKPSVDRRPR